jgi:catechol 2,3-dioxygenase-like lactoylglutathione lyase family enzyme
VARDPHAAPIDLRNPHGPQLRTWYGRQLSWSNAVATREEIQMASEMRIELIQVPVSDIDRAKSFYVEKVGFNADHDYQVSDELRFVQLTPPGSACSIALTSGAHQMTPGSVEGLQMVVDDAEASRKELADRGVEVSDVQVFPWGHFVFFKDPDGNGWALQAITRQDEET